MHASAKGADVTGAMPTTKRAVQGRAVRREGVLSAGCLLLVMCSLLPLARDVGASPSPTITINWKTDPETLLSYPSIEGHGPPSEDVTWAPPADDAEGHGPLSELGVELNCTEGAAFDFEAMRARELRKLVKDLDLPCKACAERSDFTSAIKAHVEDLSIRSLKNMVAVRGFACHVCKTKNDLVRTALQVVHLPPKTTALPIFRLGSLIFPGVKALIHVFEPRYKLLVSRALRGDKRFGVAGAGHRGALGSVVRILEHRENDDGSYLIKVVGEQRFSVEGGREEAVVGGMGALLHANVTLFVDEPLGKDAARAVHAGAKSVRRGFFNVDTDRDAAAREGTIGQPPSESLGPEALSHWMATALEMPRAVREAMFATTSTVARLKAVAGVLLERTGKKIVKA